jgi:DNA-binding response OmpR family regulator
MIAAFARVLAVEGERNARRLLEDRLGSFGFDVKTESDARTAAETVKTWSPEAIVLDIGQSGLNGCSAVQVFRRLTDVPILLTSARSEISEQITGLTCGADDYMIKPLDIEELAARIHARLRRPRMEAREVVTYADLTIDAGYRKVARGGKPLELSAREFDLLLVLARNREKVFSRSQLLDLVWGTERDVTPATVETYISYLRSKLDADGAPPIIHTVRGVGYTMRLTRPGPRHVSGSVSSALL